MQGAQPQYPYPQQQMQAQQAQLKYVGFGGRIIPSFIDALIPGIIVSALAAVHIPAASFVVVLLYPIVMEAMFGATVGKFIRGMRVRKVDGSPIGWKEAIIRNLIFIIECFTLGIITFISIANSPIRQRWGDKMAGSVVVKL